MIIAEPCTQISAESSFVVVGRLTSDIVVDYDRKELKLWDTER